MYSSNDFLKLENAVERDIKKAVAVRNLRSYLARKNATVIWGGGCGIDTQDETLQKFYNDGARRYNFIDTVIGAEEMCSMYGRCVITINKTKGGEYLLYCPDPLYFNVVGTTFYKEDLAVVGQRFTQDSKHGWIKSIYTKNKVINEIHQQVGFKETQIFDKTAEVPPELQVEKVGNHNLGFLPLVQVENYPNLAPFQSTFITGNKTTDGYNALVCEELFVQALEDFKKELKLCHSRIAIENASQQILQDISAKMVGGEVMDEEDILKDVVIDTPTGSKVSVLHGVPDFASYTNSINAIMDLYCKLANGSKFSEGGSAQKTTQEVRGTRSQQIEAVNLKTTLREKRYTELLAKLFDCYKVGNCKYLNKEYPFTFKIYGNIQREDTVFIDNIIKQVNLGTMSIVEAISQIRKITISDAQKAFDTIKEFNEANDIISTISAPQIEEPGFASDGFYDKDNGRPEEVDHE